MENQKAIGYIRVSSGEQENSLEYQEKRIKEYCQFNGLELVEILTDQKVSGFKHIYKRPEGSKLINLKERGIGNIVTKHPDRTFRNTVNALVTAEEWKEKGIILHLADAGGVSINTKSAIGTLLFTNLVSYAQFERDMTGERTAVVLDLKKSQGKVYCASIYGFNKENGKLVPNKKEQLVIRKIFKLKKDNLTCSAIAKELNKNYRTKKGGLFQHSTVQTIIKNPIHVGLITED